MRKLLTYYLVQVTEVGTDPFIYRVERDDHGDYVILVVNYQAKYERDVPLGYITKKNKRGITFSIYGLAPANIQIFLSNSAFMQLTEKEFLALTH